MGSIFQHVDLAVYDANITVRAQAHERIPPPAEHSFYGGTAGDLNLKFPPQKGFIVNPQFRLNVIAPNGHPNPTIDMLGTPCKRADLGAVHPDALVTWVPYRCVPGHGAPYPNLPVLMEEVKNFLPAGKEQTVLEVHDRQVERDLKRINDRAARGSAAMAPYHHILHAQPCHGLLVCGTRCFRYEVTIDPDSGSVDVARIDGVDDPVLLYYERDHTLSNWLYQIWSHFVSFNNPTIPDDARFPAFLIEELQARQSVDYEAFLHGYVYTALAYRWNFRDGFIVKPQAKVFEIAREYQLKYRHVRINSYADFILVNDYTIPDFMIAFYHEGYDMAAVVIEMKSQQYDWAQKERAREELHANMTKVSGLANLHVPGLAIMGVDCYKVGWAVSNGKMQPDTETMYSFQVPEKLWTIFTQPIRAFWSWYNSNWDELRRQHNLLP